MTSGKTLAFGATALLLAGTGAARAGYTIQLVSNPIDTANTMLLGINNSDQISGSTTSTGFTLTLPSSFAAQIAPAGSTSLQTVGINSAGSTDGFYVDAAGTTNGYTNIGGVFTGAVNRPGTVFNQLLGINDSNTLVGYSSATDATGATGQDAYSRSAGGTYTDINGLLPTNVNSQATGINNAGEVVGFYMPSSTTSLGFLDDGGSISTIDPFLSTFTQALGISNTGEIVGFYTDASGQHGYTDIGGSFASFDIAGAVSTTINGVNDKGQLVGFATIGDNVEGFVATPTPEPASLALLASGVLGLGLLRRRRADTRR